MSEGTKVSNQDEIAEYESLLYNLPQIQEIFGDAVSTNLDRECIFLLSVILIKYSNLK